MGFGDIYVINEDVSKVLLDPTNYNLFNGIVEDARDIYPGGTDVPGGDGNDHIDDDIRKSVNDKLYSESN